MYRQRCASSSTTHNHNNNTQRQQQHTQHTTTTHNHNNNTSRLPARVPFVFSCHLSKQLYAVDNGCRQRHGSRSKVAATAQAVPSPRTLERRSGPDRVYAPHLKRSEEGKGRGGGSRDALHGRRQFRSTSSSTTMSHLPPAPGRIGCLPCPDRRSGFSGAVWRRSR